MFIRAFQSKTAIITSYSGLAEYLGHSSIVAIPPYDKTTPFLDRARGIPPSPLSLPISPGEAKSYFHYLLGLVLGTQPSPPQPKQPEPEPGGTWEEPVDWIQEAIDQLRDMILAMTPDIEYTQDIYAMPDWEKKLGSLESKIDHLERTYQERWDKLLTAIEHLQSWLVTYQRLRRKVQATSRRWIALTQDNIDERLDRVIARFNAMLKNAPLPTETIDDFVYTEKEEDGWKAQEPNFAKRIATPLPTKRRRRVTTS